jgi:hypothetical protein
LKKIARLSVPFVAAALVGGLALSGVASANLPGSTFESNDGNMTVDNPGGTDWVNAPNLSVGVDLPSGQNDNAFGKGTSENDTNVNVVLGSIPNSKADLGRFAVASEQLSNGHQMLYLAWTRNSLSGTTNFDFEVNKLKQPDLTTPGPKVLNRSVGDLLISYDLQGGAQNPTLTSRTWTGTAWSAGTLLGSAVSEGAVNTVTIPDQLGPQSPTPAPLLGTEFGEAGIDLTAANLVPAPGTPGASCIGFASAFVKSRSSDSFSAEIKDFIAPIPTNINNCGKIVIKKVTVPSPDTSKTSFPFTLTGGSSALNDSFSLPNGGSFSTGDPPNVNPGNGYMAAENVPNGWTLTSATCDNGSPVNNIVVVAHQTTTCTFVDTAKANLHIKKVADRNGVNFTFTSSTLTPPTWQLANGQTRDFLNILPGGYDAAETVPQGWTLQSATCDNGNNPATITLNPGDDVTCTFTNVVQRGAVLINKMAKHAASGPGDHPEAGVVFTVTNATNGTNQQVTTDASGNACVPNVPVSVLDGPYTATEALPIGYQNDTPLSQSYTVVAGTTCATATALAFHNTPLTNITTQVNSRVSGGTSSTISCVDSSNNPVASGSTDANGNGSATAPNLAPGTYTCTVVVDP